MNYKLTLVILMFSCATLGAQQLKDSIPTQALDEVVLNVARIASKSLNLPMAASLILSSKNALLEPQLSINESLISVPGLFAQNAYNYNQDLRVSIRGFGARASFGIRGVKLIVDGIPETTPDGQGQIDNLIVGLIDQIEILRGPAAALYGNASGGVIYLNTLDTIQEQFRVNLSGGSYGLRLAQALINLNNKEDKTALLAVNYIQSDSYRDHAGFGQLQTNYKSKRTLTKQHQLLWQINYTNSPKAFDPGGITLEQVTEAPTAAWDANISYDARESIHHIKTGWQLKSTLKNGVMNNRLYVANRIFEGFLPFKSGGVSAFNRLYWGLGTSYQTSLNTTELEMGWSHDRQLDQRERFDNLNGIKGALQEQQDEQYTNTALYLTAHKNLGHWSVQSGLRVDHIGIRLKESSQHQNYVVLNPSLALGFQAGAHAAFYTRYSESFETPSLSELSADPNGSLGFNPELNPNKAQNYELGFKFQHSKSLLEIALFAIQSSDELISYTLEEYPGRSFYKNAGGTNRKGVEVSFNHQWGNFKLQQSYTFSDFKLSNTATGTYLPGIPKHNGYNRMSQEFSNGIELALTTVYWGSLYANSTNSIPIKDQYFSNFSLSKRFNFTNDVFAIKIGINNLTNADYFDNIRVNAWGGRYYEPAPKRNFYLGAQWSLN